jgi:hypothetical protein
MNTDLLPPNLNRNLRLAGESKFVIPDGHRAPGSAVLPSFLFLNHSALNQQVFSPFRVGFFLFLFSISLFLYVHRPPLGTRPLQAGKLLPDAVKINLWL